MRRTGTNDIAAMRASYDPVAIALHWIVAATVALQFALGWLMQEIAKQPAGPRAFAYNVHKSVGLAILALMLARLAWRIGHRPPPEVPMPQWQASAARANHAALYALLVALPVAGYLGSAFSGYPVRFFGLALPSWTAPDAALKEAMSGAHLAASWLLAMAVALHLAAVAKHELLDGDGILERMGWRRRARARAPAGAAGD
jgi:cytochrome b561